MIDTGIYNLPKYERKTAFVNYENQFCNSSETEKKL